ncbi:hypothetical protein F0U60_41975 [Archangium minus]|uniref:Phage protein n=1 Tax=Archangium minus TaxID=83450 RepID=A0ABY9X3I5_9BACT|nr:hypothetical protein F0U60_41975 [Archangium minus]
MPYIADFDIDDIISTLKSISDKQAVGSKERDAIELAQIALLYPRHTRKEDEFRKYYERFFDPSFEVTASREFVTREEADKWLASGQAQDAERVKIAGKGFMVVQLPGRMTFMDAPLPGEPEEDEPETDSE